MAYEPTEWKSGDVVTSAKLNKLEEGVANAGDLFVVGFSDEEQTTLNKTYNEIHDAMLAKKVCVLFTSYTGGHGDTNVLMGLITDAATKEEQDAVNGYALLVFTGNIQSTWIAVSEYLSDTADGYPVLNS